MGTTEDIPQGIDAILSGLSDGITIFGGSMFGMFFPELKAEADRLVAQNGGLYAWSQTFNNIGSGALQLVLMNGAIKALSWGGQGISKLFHLDKFAQTMCAIDTTGRIAGTALAVAGTGYAAYSAVRHFGEAWNHLTQGNYAKAVDSLFQGSLDTVFAAMGGIALTGLARSVYANGFGATYRQFFRSCFAAGTPLLMAHGGSKPIEQINVDDWVLARSDADEHGEIAPRQVEEVFVRSAELLELVVSGQIIKTTMEHPFWVVDAGWRDAHELNVGDRLLSHDGQELTLDAIRDTGEYATVYNLRVAEYHTYFVGCAEWGFSVWAHNTCYNDWVKANKDRINPARQDGETFNKAASRLWAECKTAPVVISVPDPVAGVADDVASWLGPNARVIRDTPASSNMMSQDGLRMFRLDLTGHGYLPHGHLQMRNNLTEAFQDAIPGRHHIYFGN